MAERLEATGRYRVLRKLEPRTVAPKHGPPSNRQFGSWQQIGIILDTEMTGLDHAAHEVSERSRAPASHFNPIEQFFAKVKHFLRDARQTPPR